MEKKINRRNMISGTVGAAGLAGGSALLGRSNAVSDQVLPAAHDAGVMGTYGEVDLSFFNPSDFLYEFDYGKNQPAPGRAYLKRVGHCGYRQGNRSRTWCVFPCLDLQWTSTGPQHSAVRKVTASASTLPTGEVMPIPFTFTVFIQRTWTAL